VDASKRRDVVMFGQLLRGGLLLGVALGAGAAIVGPAVWRTARPYAKSALRSGIEGLAAARVAAARVGEEVEDLVAEVMHEISEATEASGGDPVATPTADSDDATPRS
jgi:hypothetical protein